ncbi:MAG: DUF3050 domain-containing protein [Bacteroidetes bacterium]|nr:DUF3050 domain-containing protein [Bacteroidota bacterium]
MNPNLLKLKTEIEPLRNQLIQHSVYNKIKTINHLNKFMEHHVFAVWDFMSLLKTLQKILTCVDVPWFPIGNPQTRYLINEIVLGEESDIDEQGFRTSHFELYLNAMKQTGCNLTQINDFIKNISKKIPLEISMQIAGVSSPASNFILKTFEVINSNKTHVQAAVFTFGREDLIPGMFLSFVKELNNQTSNNVSVLKYYLERHIEVDGEHHSHLAYEMTEKLCGSNITKWEEATEEVKKSLKARISLWNAIEEQLN